jgi:hypothetical protein
MRSMSAGTPRRTKKVDTFTGSNCYRTFKKARTDEQAQAAYQQNAGIALEAVPVTVVYDDCCKLMLGWACREDLLNPDDSDRTSRLRSGLD